MFFLAYLYSAGTQHGNLHPAGWPILFCRPTQEKIGRGFGKNAGEWTGRVEIRKKSLAVSVACLAIYWPTPGFKGRTFKLCVLTRWDFNFCVRSSPLRGHLRRLRKRFIVERTNEAEIRLGEQSENTESWRENLWIEIQVKRTTREK